MDLMHISFLVFFFYFFENKTVVVFFYRAVQLLLETPNKFITHLKNHNLVMSCCFYNITKTDIKIHRLENKKSVALFHIQKNSTFSAFSMLPILRITIFQTKS